MKKRNGETVRANNGQLMTIIEYRNYDDIDVQFEDGTIVQHKEYHKFKNGGIRNPNLQIGKISISTKGQKMKIIAYRNHKDIDIEFEDGTIIEHTDYYRFLNGKIKNPNFNFRVGETNINNQGLKMKIIAYRNAIDIDVEFEDGTISKKKKYHNFKLGKIENPNLNMNDFYGFQLKKMKFNSKYFNFTKNNIHYGVFTIQEFLNSELKEI